MKRGFKRLTTRGLMLASLALVALAVLAVPAAYAVVSTTPVTVVSKTEGAYYGGVKPLQCQVAVRNQAAADYYYADKTVSPTTGIFVLVADLPLPTYSSYQAIATGYGPSGMWRNFFTASRQTFSPSYSSSGTFGLASLAFRLNVRSTTVSGKVTNARTGKAMAGVSVRLGNHYVQTSRYGTYTIWAALWPATDYRISFAKRDFRSASTLMLSRPGSIVHLNVRLWSR